MAANPAPGTLDAPDPRNKLALMNTDESQFAVSHGALGSESLQV